MRQREERVIMPKFRAMRFARIFTTLALILREKRYEC